jgi:hypothetical protein
MRSNNYKSLLSLLLLLLLYDLVLGLRPTVKLGSDTLCRPLIFESPKCICICARITHKYTKDNKNGTQMYFKRLSFY